MLLKKPGVVSGLFSLCAPHPAAENFTGLLHRASLRTSSATRASSADGPD